MSQTASSHAGPRFPIVAGVPIAHYGSLDPSRGTAMHGDRARGLPPLSHVTAPRHGGDASLLLSAVNKTVEDQAHRAPEPHDSESSAAQPGDSTIIPPAPVPEKLQRSSACSHVCAGLGLIAVSVQFLGTLGFLEFASVWTVDGRRFRNAECWLALLLLAVIAVIWHPKCGAVERSVEARRALTSRYEEERSRSRSNYYCDHYPKARTDCVFSMRKNYGLFITFSAVLLLLLTAARHISGVSPRNGPADDQEGPDTGGTNWSCLTLGLVQKMFGVLVQVTLVSSYET